VSEAAQALPPGDASAAERLQAPSLRRRFAAFAYEGVLLFGVWMAVTGIYSVATGMRHALQGRTALMALLVAAMGLYFIWFWSHGGQTVAMKAWHVRLVDTHAGPVRPLRALARYLLAWLWFVPALVAAQLSGLKSGGSAAGIVLAGIVAYALLSRLHPQRQFWHDVVCGTRLVDSRQFPVPRAR
jgi:uncharacterized RDD family membrane protein YckC